MCVLDRCIGGHDKIVRVAPLFQGCNVGGSSRQRLIG